MKRIRQNLVLAVSAGAFHLAAGSAIALVAAGSDAAKDVQKLAARQVRDDARSADAPAAAQDRAPRTADGSEDVAPRTTDATVVAQDRAPRSTDADRPTVRDDAERARDNGDRPRDHADRPIEPVDNDAIPGDVVICFASPEYHADIDCAPGAAVVTFLVSGTWPDSCVPEGLDVQVRDGRIDVATKYYSQPTIGCADVPTFWYLTVRAGPLPNGDYQVYTTINSVNHRGVAVERPSISVRCATEDCYANCDGSRIVPALNIADFSCFLHRFSAGDPWANCDGSTAEPVLNIADFSCFLQKFAAGCH
jgi:hypothetical protein